MWNLILSLVLKLKIFYLQQVWGPSFNSMEHTELKNFSRKFTLKISSTTELRWFMKEYQSPFHLQQNQLPLQHASFPVSCRYMQKLVREVIKGRWKQNELLRISEDIMRKKELELPFIFAYIIKRIWNGIWISWHFSFQRPYFTSLLHGRQLGVNISLFQQYFMKIYE